MESRTETRVHTHVYNTAEKGWPYKTAQWSLIATIRGRYYGRLAKGYWALGSHWRLYTYFEAEFALGGEDGMIQFGLTLPWIGKATIGIGAARALLKPWIYERREWTLRIGYIGRWAELMIASDEHMRDTGMVSGASRSARGSLSANPAASTMASTKASMVALLSVSVGSIMMASLTFRGK